MPAEWLLPFGLQDFLQDIQTVVFVSLTLLSQALCVCALVLMRSIKVPKMLRFLENNNIKYSKIQQTSRRAYKKFKRRAAQTLPLQNSKKIRHFEKMTKNVIADASNAILEGDLYASEAKALLPIVLEVRKYGENLLSKQEKSYFSFLSSVTRVKQLVKDLDSMEKMLRNIPKSKLTIDDVLLGKFETAEKNSTKTFQEN